MKKMNVKKFARTFLVLIAVFALACAFSSMAFAADGETAAAAPDNNMGIGMIAAAEAGALLLYHGDKLHRSARPDLVLMKDPRRLQPGDDAGRAVEVEPFIYAQH